MTNFVEIKASVVKNAIKMIFNYFRKKINQFEVQVNGAIKDSRFMPLYLRDTPTQVPNNIVLAN